MTEQKQSSAPPMGGNVIKIRKYHYIRTDMSIKHICFFMQKNT